MSNGLPVDVWGTFGPSVHLPIFTYLLNSTPQATDPFELDFVYKYTIFNLLSCLQRYYYYITKGIDSSQLAGPPPGQMERIQSTLPEKLIESQTLAPVLEELKDEVNSDFDFSYRKSISKYW